MKDGKGHPRSTGTFSQVLGRYVREAGSLTIMDALRKMTVMPSKRLEARVPEMRDKGRLRVGAFQVAPNELALSMNSASTSAATQVGRNPFFTTTNTIEEVAIIEEICGAISKARCVGVIPCEPRVKSSSLNTTRNLRKDALTAP